MLKISWDEADGIKQRAVKRGLERKEERVCPQIGIDEKSYGKGNKFVTIVASTQEETTIVEHVGDGKGKDGLEGYWSKFEREELQAIETISMDMSSAYRQSVIENVPESPEKVVFDRFHIMQHVNESLHVPDLGKASDAFARAKLLAEEGFVAYYAIPLVAKEHVHGVLEIFNRKSLTPDKEWLEFLKILATQGAILVNHALLFADLQRSNTELVMAYDRTIEGWSCALDMRDQETEGHTQRVVDLTLNLARAMGVSEEKLIHVRRGALLHDIGKIGVPDRILHKPGPLLDEEWVIMRQHPIYAFAMLSPISYLSQALDIPYCHHEKWDGSGYPRALKGEQIPLLARIFAVADVCDALRFDRPYRKGMAEAQVIEYMRSNAGTHFDPQVVEAFLKLERIGL